MDPLEVQSCVEIIRGPDLGKIFVLDKEVSIIGRSWYCDISLNDASISRQHAQLSFDEGKQGKVSLKDLNSSNGVFLNTKRISYARVNPGDEILVGKSVLQVRQLTETELDRYGYQVQREDVEYVSSRGELIASIEVDEATGMPINVQKIDRKSAGKRLRTMHRLSEILAGSEQLEEKVEQILSIIFDDVNAESGVILIKDAVNDKLEPTAFRHRENEEPIRFRVSWTIIERCIQERIGILANDAQVDPRFDKAESIVHGKFKSVLSIPLFSRDKILGVIFMSTSLQSGLFSETDLEFLMSLAHQMALVIEHDHTITAHMIREKMAEVGELVSGLSYYLKNVLITFSNSRELIEEALKHNQMEAIRHAWPGITDAADKIQDMVANMLYFAAEPLSEEEKIDLNKLLEEMLVLYKPVIDEKRFHVTTDLSADLPECHVDRTSIARVFRNIFQNALEAVWDEKTPEIRVTTNWKQKNRLIEIKFVDNGCGIAPQNINKIFHYLFSTKGYEGTGLGLFIVKQTIEEHGGTISVYSNVNQGCELTIHLPLERS